MDNRVELSDYDIDRISYIFTEFMDDLAVIQNIYRSDLKLTSEIDNVFKKVNIYLSSDDDLHENDYRKHLFYTKIKSGEPYKKLVKSLYVEFSVKCDSSYDYKLGEYMNNLSFMLYKNRV